MNEFARIRKLTFSSSPWVENFKTDKIWICESVGKLKVIGKQGEVKKEGYQHSHHCQFTKVCSIIWVAQAENL